MMKFLSSRSAIAAIVCSAGVLGSPAALAQATFNAAASGDQCNPTGSSLNAYASVTCTTTGGVTPTLQAWGFTGATLSSAPTTGFTRGALGDFNASGFGAYTGSKETTTDGQHAFDNVTTGCGTGSSNGNSTSLGTLSGANGGCGGSIEALLLDFGSSKVNLTDVGVGWSSVDSELQVWAWTGKGVDMTNQTAVGGSSAAAALAGWQLVSTLDMDSGGSDCNNTTVICRKSTGNTLYSSYFLITTYFGATNGSLEAGNDRFKIDLFTVALCTQTLSGGSTGGTGAAQNGNGATCGPSQGGGVPEPGSLVLAGLAFIGLIAKRRKGVAG
jgi:hypothetical protein